MKKNIAALFLRGIILLLVIVSTLSACAPNMEKLIDDENVPKLIRALKFRGDAAIREEAATVLGEIGDKDAIDPLIKCMSSDEEEDVREAATIALDRFKDDDIIVPLIARLGDESTKVQTAARIALVDYEEDAVEALIAAFEEAEDLQRPNIISVLQQMEEFAVEPLITALTDANEAIRSGSFDALSALEAAAMPELILALDTEDTALQQQIIAVLLTNEETAAEFLVEALGSEDEQIAAQSKMALVLMGDNAVQPLTKILNSTDEQVVTLAVEALVEIGDPAIQPVIEVLADADREEHAAIVLAQIGEPAIEKMIAALADEDIQSALTALLVGIGEPAIAPLIGQLSNEELMSPASAVLIEMGDIAIEQIIIAFEEDPDLAEGVINPLVSALTVYDRHTRESAADALVAIGEPAVQPLIDVLKEHHKLLLEDGSEVYASEMLYSPQDTVTGVMFYGNYCEDPGEWEDMIVLCQRGENNFYEKAEAVQEGGGIGMIVYNNEEGHLIATLGADFEGTIPVVLVTQAEGKALVADHNFEEVTLVSQDQYFNADDALIAMGTTALPSLIDTLPEDTTYTQIETIILGMDTTAVPLLIEAMEHDEEYVRSRAISILGYLADERAVQPIIAAFDDHSAVVRAEAAYSMSAFTSPAALDPLIELLGDTDEGVVASVKDALDAYDVSAPNRLLEVYADETLSYRDEVESALISYFNAHTTELTAAAQGVCGGTPIENATAYARWEEGPHPVYILTSSSAYSYWNTYTPVEWRPYSPEQIQAVVCTDTYEKVVVQVCRYYYTSTGAAAPSKTRYRYKSTGGLYDASTAKLLGSFALYGSLPDYCPYSSSSSSSTSITGGYIEYDDMEKWLQSMGFRWE